MDRSATTHSMRPTAPIISWPIVTAGPLSASIAEMQRLNPDLGLRCAVEIWQPDFAKLDPRTAAKMRHDLEELPTPQYLLHEGTSLDVVTIVMPEPPTDQG